MIVGIFFDIFISHTGFTDAHLNIDIEDQISCHDRQRQDYSE